MATRKNTKATDEPQAQLPVKVPSLNDLAALALGGKAHEDAERAASGGVQRSYIKLIGDAEDDVLNPNAKGYIKGAKYGGYCIPNKGVTLGMNPTVTVVGMFKLYEESIPSPNAAELPKVLSYWHPEDAEQIPVDGIFNRPFTANDGSVHTLKPVHWLCVVIEGKEEIQDALLTFRSTGNTVYSALQKLLKHNCSISPELRLKLSFQKIKNEKFNKTNLFPAFEIVGKNFDFNPETGKIKLVEDGPTSEDLSPVLTLYKSLAEEYTSYNMIQRKRSVAALLGDGAGSGATASGKKGTKALADEDDDATF